MSDLENTSLFSITMTDTVDQCRALRQASYVGIFLHEQFSIMLFHSVNILFVLFEIIYPHTLHSGFKGNIKPLSQHDMSIFFFYLVLVQVHQVHFDVPSHLILISVWRMEVSDIRQVILLIFHYVLWMPFVTSYIVTLIGSI